MASRAVHHLVALVCSALLLVGGAGADFTRNSDDDPFPPDHSNRPPDFYTQDDYPPNDPNNPENLILHYSDYYNDTEYGKMSAMHKYYRCLCMSVQQEFNIGSVPCRKLEEKEYRGTFFGSIQSLEILENSGLELNGSHTFSRLAVLRLRCGSLVAYDRILECWCAKLNREFGTRVPCTELMEELPSFSLETLLRNGIDVKKSYIKAEVMLLLNRCSLPPNFENLH